jgi:hypothetical protein
MRLIDVLRGRISCPENDAAKRRSAEIARMVEKQDSEVQQHRSYALHVIAENHLAEKIRRALREAP